MLIQQIIGTKQSISQSIDAYLRAVFPLRDGHVTWLSCPWLSIFWLNWAKMSECRCTSVCISSHGIYLLLRECSSLNTKWDKTHLNEAVFILWNIFWIARANKLKVGSSVTVIHVHSDTNFSGVWRLHGGLHAWVCKLHVILTWHRWQWRLWSPQTARLLKRTCLLDVLFRRQPGRL